MSLTLPADAGKPLSTNLIATTAPERHAFGGTTRQVSLRNTGTNTLWITLDKKNWFDIACGTSWDDRVNVDELWHCTQVGKTRFVVIGVSLLDP